MRELKQGNAKLDDEAGRRVDQATTEISSITESVRFQAGPAEAQ